MIDDTINFMRIKFNSILYKTNIFHVAARLFRLGSLSTRVFETGTATGREHFVCQDSVVFQIFILITSNGEKILTNVNVVV